MRFAHREIDRRHRAAPAQTAHQRAATADDSGRILEGQRTRDVRCGDFAHALSDHNVGPHTRLTERGRESHLKRKEERLEHHRCAAPGVRTRHRPFEGSTSRLRFGSPYRILQAIDAPRDWREQVAPHPEPLRSLPRKHENKTPLGRRRSLSAGDPRVHLDRRDRFELFERLRSIGKSERRAMVVVRAPTLRRVAQVAHREQFVARELRPEGLRHERDSSSLAAEIGRTYGRSAVEPPTSVFASFFGSDGGSSTTA